MDIADQFKNLVGLKFQLYNSLFTSLPFHRIEKTNTHLMMFTDDCEEGYKKGLNPQQIVEDFFSRTPSIITERERIDTLFRFIQYVERQVVLFDALEDAAFREIHDVNGEGSLREMEQRIKRENLQLGFTEALKTFAVSLVLTAHPTQFYPGAVLGIIHDLARALKENDVRLINTYLQQLGKTPLLKKEKPTPYLEAMSLVWYLENVFYTAAGKLLTQLKTAVPELDLSVNPVIKMGFWPGGDRDGNPNVNADTTLKVADALRSSILKCYYLDVRKIKRRITFKNADVILAELESKLYNNIFIPGNRTDLAREDILDSLNRIREIIVYEHNGLFLHLLDNLIYKVQAFGLHFASLDLRQESSVHGTVLEALRGRQFLPEGYNEFSETEKIDTLGDLNAMVSAVEYEGMIKDTIESFETVATIQHLNGRAGCYRYIISQCKTALNVMEVYGLFMLTGYNPEDLHVDIVPLFETIDDLRHAPEVMKQLYENGTYKRHLAQRNKIQTIMLGFSDGTKDGGYLMANWRIYKAKETLSALSKTYGI
ncbi:MAG: phosphoenolpyruvate carboxylase, partial [Flavisolibacter sp.]